MSYAPVAVNAALFYAGWYVCVVWRMPWAVAVAVIAVAVHLLWVRRRPGEARVLAAAAAIGIAVDTALTASGVFAFAEAATGALFGAVLPPLWLCALWLVFATTLDVSLRPFGPRPLLAGLLGAVAGPFSYWLGFRLGAVGFPLGTPATLAILAPVWAVLFPLLLRVAFRP